MLRRTIAKIALDNLIVDGRIQPARIEEMVEKTKAEVGEIVKQKGEAAAYEVGVIGLDQKLVDRLILVPVKHENLLEVGARVTQQLKPILFRSGQRPFVRVDNSVRVILKTPESDEPLPNAARGGSGNRKTLRADEEGRAMHRFDHSGLSPFMEECRGSRVHVASR